MINKVELSGRGLVWRCDCCGAWCDPEEGEDRAQFRRIRHSKRCSDAAAQPPAILAEDRTKAERDGAARMRAHAKRGDLALHYSDAEIAEAVRAGVISMGDAMNQDF